MTSDKPKGNKPVHEISDGLLKVTVWKNEGEYGPMYSVTCRRRYKAQYQRSCHRVPSALDRGNIPENGARRLKVSMAKPPISWGSSPGTFPKSTKLGKVQASAVTAHLNASLYQSWGCTQTAPRNRFSGTGPTRTARSGRTPPATARTTCSRWPSCSATPMAGSGSRNRPTPRPARRKPSRRPPDPIPAP